MKLKPSNYPSVKASGGSSSSIGSSETVSSSSIESDNFASVDATTQRQPLNKVHVTGRLLILSILGSMLISFAAGRATRLLLIEGPVKSLLKQVEDSTKAQDREPTRMRTTTTPTPLIAQQGHVVPQTRYLSKNFDTARSAIMSTWLAASRGTQSSEGVRSHVSVSKKQNDSEACSAALNKEEVSVDSSSTQKERRNHVGEHLMVDIKNVDGAFLDSESRLSRAIIDLINEAQLTLLSYHCHGLFPSGVSCAGILLRNYIAFHTWPEEGVITFDLVSTESKSLLPILSATERFFGVPQTPSYPGQGVEKPDIRWSHDYRGFRNEVFTDLEYYVLSDIGIELKQEVASVETDFQHIDIYDVTFPHSANVDRVVFLDGWIQSTRLHEAAYHEALAHPALFTHPNPRRVVIIGGGEGATLREVLKHNTVREAIMIEIDEMMVDASRDYLPEWSDCSDLVGSSPWCVNDPRVKVYYDDALKWFMGRYAGEENAEGLIDVIILDALDPEFEIPMAKALYGNNAFMKAFFNSLSDDGILVMQLGEAPKSGDPNEMHSRFRNRATTTAFLENPVLYSRPIVDSMRPGHTLLDSSPETLGCDGTQMQLLSKLKSSSEAYQQNRVKVRFDISMDRQWCPTRYLTNRRK